FLFRACRAFNPSPAFALTVLFVYLFLPLGITVSHTFQPESAMTCGFCLTLWMLLRQNGELDWKQTALSAAVSGLANLIKPGVLFFPLVGAFVGLSWSRNGFKRT